MGTTHLYRLLGFTPLHVAVSARGRDDIDQALREGADIDAATVDGLTPLMLAVRHREASFVSLLIKHGADPGIPDKKGRTPWQVAVRARDSETMGLLATAGASHHVLGGSSCALCRVPQAALEDVECRPGSLAALELRLAESRGTHHPPDGVEDPLCQWRPRALPPRRILLIAIRPSLVDRSEAWEIREDGDTDPEYRLVGVFVRRRYLDKTLEIDPFPVERTATERMLNQLRDSEITAAPRDAPMGFDGTSYELLIEDWSAGLRLRWWGEGPSAWHPLVSGAHQVISFLKDSQARCSAADL